LSSSSVAITASTCPFTFTFRQTAAILPSGSMMNVLRSTPMYSFPYIFLGTQAPYASIVRRSVSERRRIERLCLSENRRWLAVESGLMPKTGVSSRANASLASENDRASRVHPDVLSFG